MFIGNIHKLLIKLNQTSCRCFTDHVWYLCICGFIICLWHYDSRSQSAMIPHTSCWQYELYSWLTLFHTCIGYSYCMFTQIHWALASYCGEMKFMTSWTVHECAWTNHEMFTWFGSWTVHHTSLWMVEEYFMNLKSFLNHS